MSALELDSTSGTRALICDQWAYEFEPMQPHCQVGSGRIREEGVWSCSRSEYLAMICI